MDEDHGRGRIGHPAIPNLLTLARVVLTFAFFHAVTLSGLRPLLWAALFFSLASATDFYDGYYARKHDLVTNFGKIMDPIADKFLVLTAFFVFSRMHIIAGWMFDCIFAREVIVTGSRILAIRRGHVLAAEQAGRIKTALQVGVISMVLLFLILTESRIFMLLPEAVRGGWTSYWGRGITALMEVTVVVTLFSGVSYFWNNRRILFAGGIP